MKTTTTTLCLIIEYTTNENSYKGHGAPSEQIVEGFEQFMDIDLVDDGVIDSYTIDVKTINSETSSGDSV